MPKKTITQKQEQQTTAYVPKPQVAYDYEILALRDSGYDAYYDGGVLMVTMPREQYEDSKARSELAKTLVAIGYRNSWGMRPIIKEA